MAKMAGSLSLRYLTDVVPLRGMIFDLDGTLTEPVLDFAEIKRTLGLPLTANIIESIESWDCPDRRRWGHEQVELWEQRALDKFLFAPGVPELLRLLDARQIPRAVVTRNTVSSLEMLNRHLETHGLPFFSHTLARDFTPTKPHPQPLIHIVERWRRDIPALRDVQHAQVLMVGDARDDLRAGRACGIATCFLRTDPSYADRHRDEIAQLADVVFNNIDELLTHLTTHGVLDVPRPLIVEEGSASSST